MDPNNDFTFLVMQSLKAMYYYLMEISNAVSHQSYHGEEHF
jgi:hypothetical protein